MLATQPPEASPEHQTRDPRGRIDSDRYRQPVRLGRLVEIAESRARLGSHRPFGGVHFDLAKFRVVDHQPAVAERTARDVVARPAHGNEQVMRSGKVDARRCVVGARALHDQAGTLVDHGIPYGPDLVVVGVLRDNHAANYRRAQGGESRVVDRHLATGQGSHTDGHADSSNK